MSELNRYDDADMNRAQANEPATEEWFAKHHCAYRTKWLGEKNDHTVTQVLLQRMRDAEKPLRTSYVRMLQDEAKRLEAKVAELELVAAFPQSKVEAELRAKVKELEEYKTKYEDLFGKLAHDPE